MTRRAWGTGFILAVAYALIALVVVVSLARARDTDLEALLVAVPVAVSVVTGFAVGLFGHWIAARITQKDPDPVVAVTTGTLAASGSMFVLAFLALRPLGPAGGILLAAVLALTTHLVVGHRLRPHPTPGR